MYLLADQSGIGSCEACYKKKELSYWPYKDMLGVLSRDVTTPAFGRVGPKAIMGRDYKGVTRARYTAPVDCCDLTRHRVN